MKADYEHEHENAAVLYEAQVVRWIDPSGSRHSAFMALPSKAAPWLTGVIGIAIGIEIAIGGYLRHGADNWRVRGRYSPKPTPDTDSDSDSDFDEWRVLGQHSVTGAL